MLSLINSPNTHGKKWDGRYYKLEPPKKRWMRYQETKMLKKLTLSINKAPRKASSKSALCFLVVGLALGLL